MSNLLEKNCSEDKLWSNQDDIVSAGTAQLI